MCKRRIEFFEGFLSYRPYKLLNIVCPYKKIHIFPKVDLFFFQFPSKIKINSMLHSSRTFSSMCKRRIDSVEGLPRYWPYKLMNIHMKKNRVFFQRFLFFFQFSRKIKINSLLHSSDICSFLMQKKNWIRWGVADILAVQTYAAAQKCRHTDGQDWIQ